MEMHDAYLAEPSGVLPVHNGNSYIEAHSLENSKNVSQNSYLHDFVLSSPQIKESQQFGLVGFMTKSALQDNGNIKLRPDDPPTTMSSTTGPEQGWWGWEPTDNYYFDAFGSNLPSYGIQQVEVIGHKIPSFWNFPDYYMNDAEYSYLLDGGASGSTPPPGSGNCFLSQVIDWAFIEAREGHNLDGNVPSKDGVPLGKSGVTIGSGFDIGQHSAQEIRDLNLGADLTARLLPFATLKGQLAVDKLSQVGLHITQSEEMLINAQVHSDKAVNLIVAYDNAVGYGAFYKLPGAAQTIIASVSFQYGSLAIATPNFWNDVIHKDWGAAIAELRNFGDDYGPRRNLEADYLQSALNNGKLPVC